MFFIRFILEHYPALEQSLRWNTLAQKHTKDIQVVFKILSLLYFGVLSIILQILGVETKSSAFNIS